MEGFVSVTRGTKSMMLKMLTIIAAFAIFATACGGSDGGTTTEESPDTTEEAMEDTDADPEPEESSDTTEPESDAIVTEAEDDSDLEVVVGGVARIGLEAEVDGLNPTGSALSAPGMYMASQVFDNLVRADTNNQPVPFLAESFTPNDDFTSWEMKLREGITFHDGTPLNSEAIRANFEVVIADPLVGLAVAPFFPPVDEGALEIVDDLTVRYNLVDSNANFPTSFYGQLGMVASPTWLAAAAEDPTLNQAPVGTGPFVFESRSEDSVTRFVRNDNWWNGSANLDAIEFVPVTDPDVRSNLLLEGELNMLQTTNAASIEILAEDESIQNILDDTGEESFAMLNTSQPPFDDIRARQALTWATPRDNYNTLIGLGIQRPADQMFTPDSPYYNPDVVQEADDPDRAVEMAAEYCGAVPDSCTDGKINMELQWSGPSVVQTRIAELLDEGWSVAFNVEFQEVPQDQHIQETAFGLYNAVTWRQFGAINPGDDWVWLLCRTAGGISLNWPQVCDEERDELLLAAQATTDEAERAAIFQELVAKINQDYTYVFFFHTLWDIALAQSVKGVCNDVAPDGTTVLKCNTNGRTWMAGAFLSE